ncbi:thioredoxin [Mycoplasmopsis mustelae]|uniref:Thioredoxin n=1 Tax=Mycoplasmopsis mustelae TaxID=171289 RepID=A0A4R7UCQ2_9BACT|nr:thioredoxin family protein [Mycoplasmopsis mustelae]TDV24222.1 thioredoxin [Mycoplasmopsis mustelae]
MLTEANKEQVLEAMKSPKAKLVVFYAEWCGPCRMYKSSLDELADKDHMEILRFNIDSDKHFAREMGVETIPFSKVYENGALVKQFTGFRPYEALKDEIKNFLK